MRRIRRQLCIAKC